MRAFPRTKFWFSLFRLACLAVLIQCVGCYGKPKSVRSPNQTMPRRDINAVLDDHDDTLMAIPGVVGVYVGLDQDGRTTCLKVMVVRKTPELLRKIPTNLEGYSVVVEETGVIRPLGGN